MEKKQVIVVDDFPVITEGLKACLAKTEDLSLCGAANSVYQLKAILDNRFPDVILLDSVMPCVVLPEIIASLKKWAPKVPIVLFCPAEEEYTTLFAFQNGVRGHLLKTAPPDEILKALRTVAWGGTYLSGSAAERLTEYVANVPLEYSPATLKKQLLSARELDVLKRLVNGETLTEIAKESGLSPKTIGTYRERIRDKLGVKSLAAMVRYALDNNLISQD